MARDDENLFDDDFFDDEFDDDEFDDEFDGPNLGPVPHPDDRLWRHPSELAAAQAAGASAASGANPSFFGSDVATGRINNWRRTRPLVATAATIAVIAIGISQLNNAEVTPEPAVAALDSITIESSFASTALSAPFRNDDTGTDTVAWRNHLHDRIAPTAPTVLALSESGVTKQLGLVFDELGHIVTTATGLDGAEAIRIVDLAGNELDATIVGADAISDLAVLSTEGKLDATPLPLVESAPRVGDLVLVLDDDGRQTTEIARVNATRQIFNSSGMASFFDAVHIDLVDTEPLSGTPALNDTGSVVGLVTGPSLAASDPATNRYAMIPGRTVAEVTGEILESGAAVWPWLGVELDSVDDPNSGAVGVHDRTTVAVVHDGSPAAQSGLQVGDQIKTIDGQPVTSIEMIGRTVQSASVGEPVDLLIDRAGAERQLSATLTGRSDASSEATPVPTPG